jgi:hypothetical protein
MKTMIRFVAASCLMLSLLSLPANAGSAFMTTERWLRQTESDTISEFAQSAGYFQGVWDTFGPDVEETPPVGATCDFPEHYTLEDLIYPVKRVIENNLKENPRLVKYDASSNIRLALLLIYCEAKKGNQ